MPDKTPPNPQQALAGCSLVIALVCTITLGVLWLVSGKGFDSAYAVPTLIGVVLCAILGNQVETKNP